MGLTLEAINVSDEWFEHHGIKGQKWGVRRTPEQLGHILKKKNAKYYGQYNAAVRRIGEIQGTKTVSQLSPKEKAKMLKATEKAESYLKKMEGTESKYGAKIEKAETRQKAAEEKVAAKEESERVKNEKLKADILNKQDWNKAYEHKELFSTNELNDLATRVNTERRLQEALEGPSKMDAIAKKAKSAAGMLGAGLDVYNKVKDIGEILDEGKKNAAYKEIRQLMADGKNAEVIKKSIDISDKDVELFNKRAAFIKSMSPKEEKKDEKSDYVTEKLQEHKLKEVMDLFDSKISEIDRNEISIDQALKNNSKKIKGYESIINENLGKWNESETLYGTVEGTGKNSGRAHGIRGQKWTEIIDVPYEEVKESKLIEQKDKYLPLVLNDIGDFKIDDLRK